MIFPAGFNTACGEQTVTHMYKIEIKNDDNFELTFNDRTDAIIECWDIFHNGYSIDENNIVTLRKEDIKLFKVEKESVDWHG